MNKLKRYLVFIVGLFASSMGVAFITKASLGTSPITSIPYVLSLNLKLSLGNYTILMSIVLILLQIAILRKNFKPEHLLQLPFSFVFGYMIDFCMWMMSFLNPQFYPVKIVTLLFGCFILGTGVWLEVIANVVMLPGESFVRAIVFRLHKEFGIVKIFCDSSFAIIAIILSFALSGKLEGVREGTIISALIVGYIARCIGKWLSFVPPRLFPEK